MAILSNKSHGFTVNCVQDLLPKWRFAAVFGLRDDVPRKPDPAGALEIAELLKLAPEQIIYLGDTAIDMQTAVSAGMFAVGALWGFRTGEEMLKNGAAAIIEHPGDLLQWI
jgi:phosphoglycolate phosphatase